MPDSLSGLRILIVEDETLVALMIEDMLTDFGCEVVGVVGRVSAALRLIGEQAIDGAVLDVNLGVEKVFPVAETLAEKGIPFVFSTGYGAAGLPDHLKQRPTLQKPYRPEDLERSMRAELTGRR